MAQSILIHPQDNNLWYVIGSLAGSASESAIYITPDGGQTWQTVYTGKLINTIILDPQNANTLYASEYGRLIDRFYKVTTNIIYQYGGMVEKLVGDEVAAFFPPAFTEDNNHARAAVKAGQAILAATGHKQGREPWVPLGLGIHTGEAFVGAVGEPGRNINITVLGDNVNIASRLCGQALAGEIVISETTRQMAGLDQSDLEFRSLTLKGKESPVDAWIYRSRLNR